MPTTNPSPIHSSCFTLMMSFVPMSGPLLRMMVRLPPTRRLSPPRPLASGMLYQTAPNSLIQMNSLSIPITIRSFVTSTTALQLPSSTPTSSSSTSVTEVVHRSLPPRDQLSGGPYSPLYGLPIRRDLPEYTYDEVDQHNRPDSYWIVLDSHVYDVTKFQHPGGREVFAYGHGTDVGEQFAKIHHVSERPLTKRYLIGRIKSGSQPNHKPKPRRPPPPETDTWERIDAFLSWLGGGSIGVLTLYFLLR